MSTLRGTMSTTGAPSSADAAGLSIASGRLAWQATPSSSAVQTHQRDAIARIRASENVMRPSIRNVWDQLAQDHRRVFMVGDSLMRDQATYVNKILNSSSSKSLTWQQVGKAMTLSAVASSVKHSAAVRARRDGIATSRYPSAWPQNACQRCIV